MRAREGGERKEVDTVGEVRGGRQSESRGERSVGSQSERKETVRREGDRVRGEGK